MALVPGCCRGGQSWGAGPVLRGLAFTPGCPALSSLPLPATAANPEPRSGGPGALVGARFPASLPNNQLVITQGFGGSWRGPFRSTDYLVVYYFEVVTRLCAEGTHRPEGAGSRGPLSVAHPAPRGSRGASLVCPFLCRCIFTRGALDSCLTLSGAGPSGGGGPSRGVFLQASASRPRPL